MTISLDPQRPRPSAAHLKVPSSRAIAPTPPRREIAHIKQRSTDVAPGPRKSIDVDAVFGRLRWLRDSSGTNRNDQVLVLIEACIAEGIRHARRITGALEALGFNKRHVGIQLTLNTGTDPARHRWSRDDQGLYSLMPDEG